jgi:MFS family permease
MLAVNYGIEIFPDKGRSAYLAFSRFFIGIASMISPFFAGWVMTHFHDIQINVGGVVLDRYYLCFAAGALLTCTCVIPLLIAGKRKVGE